MVGGPTDDRRREPDSGRARKGKGTGIMKGKSAEKP